jgi:hypothetical protein
MALSLKVWSVFLEENRSVQVPIVVITDLTPTTPNILCQMMIPRQFSDKQMQNVRLLRRLEAWILLKWEQYLSWNQLAIMDGILVRFECCSQSGLCTRWSFRDNSIIQIPNVHRLKSIFKWQVIVIVIKIEADCSPFVGLVNRRSSFNSRSEWIGGFTADDLTFHSTYTSP